MMADSDRLSAADMVERTRAILQTVRLERASPAEACTSLFALFDRHGFPLDQAAMELLDPDQTTGLEHSPLQGAGGPPVTQSVDDGR